MPFTRVAVPSGFSADSKQAIALGVYSAMVAAIGIPEDDFFQLLNEYHPGDFFFDRSYLDIERSESLVVIQITLKRGRSDQMKRQLYAQNTSKHKAKPNKRKEDVFIYLSENDFSDWSVGGGKM